MLPSDNLISLAVQYNTTIAKLKRYNASLCLGVHLDHVEYVRIPVSPQNPLGEKLGQKCVEDGDENPEYRAKKVCFENMSPRLQFIGSAYSKTTSSARYVPTSYLLGLRPSRVHLHTAVTPESARSSARRTPKRVRTGSLREESVCLVVLARAQSLVGVFESQP